MPEISPIIAIILVVLIGSFAGFSHGVTGFGVGIVSISMYSLFMPIQQAAALGALTALSTGIVILRKYARQIRIRPVLRLLAAALVGQPIGIFFVQKLDQTVALRTLGAVLVAFCAYSLCRPKMPRLQHPAWAYPFGLTSGILAGAFNAGGPPAIVFGLMNGWDDKTFKSNITGYMLTNMVVLIFMHGAYGNYTSLSFVAFAALLPFLIVGVLGGLRAASIISPIKLKRIMLFGLLLIGGKYLLFAN